MAMLVPDPDALRGPVARSGGRRRARCGAPLLAILAACALAGCGGERPDVHDVGVRVARVAFDPLSNTPVVVLEESDGPRHLLIWIGDAEARSIAQRLERIDLPRPNTHDLAQRLVEGLEGDVERVTVTDLRDGTYYAVIALTHEGHRVEIDARPSDAIALALRTAAPLFVREPLLEPPVPKPDDEAPARIPVPDEPGQRT